jgi:hypothetical protein
MKGTKETMKKIKEKKTKNGKKLNQIKKGKIVAEII